MDAAILALFWVIVALIGAMAGLAFVLALGKGR